MSCLHKPGPLNLKKLLLPLFLLSALCFVSGQELFPGEVTAKGDVIVFGGRVLDTSGQPVTGASVEIWQTDDQGVYDHPGDANTSRRDRGFQFFGTSFTDSSGYYSFRTILPGQYEPRPRHIHVKVRQSGREVLTTQIYFVKDARGFGGSTRNLMMELQEKTRPDGTVFFTGEFDFVVNSGGRGELRLTESQGEGPYYPMADLSLYDSDLARVDSE